MKVGAWIVIAAALVMAGCQQEPPKRQAETGRRAGGAPESPVPTYVLPPLAPPAAKSTPAPARAEAPAVEEEDEAPPAVVAPAATPARAAAEAANPNARVAILAYHRFGEKIRQASMDITPAAFTAQMEELRKQGIAVISLQDLLAWKRGEKSIPGKCAVITIDDGYKSAREVAWPILRKMGYPFTLFIYTDYVRGGALAGGESLSWEQLAEMRNAGVGIESHTVTHSLGGGAQAAAGEARLWQELSGSKAMLEKQLGIKISALALPTGSGDPHVREVAARAGYSAVFTGRGQKITSSTPLNAMGRYMIDSGNTDLFPLAINFAVTPAAGAPAAAAAAPAARKIATDPVDGATLRAAPAAIRANLSDLGAVEPGSVAMRIGGIGLVPVTYDPETRTVSYGGSESLPAGAYTVIVSARVGERKVKARWNFTIAAGGRAAPRELAKAEGPSAVRRLETPAKRTAPRVAAASADSRD